MALNRHLAAIMFTDIEGYTMLMQQNEEHAIAIRNRHREIIQQQHGIFGGEIIQYYGDGTLSIFPSAVQAVQCALEMQLLYRQEPFVPVRIGLHMGDIVHTDDGIMGDGVNMASRIESLSVAGSVLMSDKVNDEINNHPELETYSAGIYQLKNIRKATEVFVLAHEKLEKPAPNSLKGKIAVRKTTAKTNGEKPKSIAVLPFDNISNDPEQDYFSNGIAEEILNSLSTLKELKVANRSSSFQFNTKTTSLREIGDKLGVSAVLEGSVRRQGKRLRVTVQLVNVDDGFHMWSEKYDGHMDDIFAIQDKIALSTTEKLKISLFDKGNALVNRNRTNNPEAYELYLKGKGLVSKRGAYIITGMHCFQLATDLDPGFAQAHAGFADANFMAAFYGLLPPLQVIYQAKRSAETAIQLDPALPEAYCSLACYYTCFEWNLEQGEKYFLKSIELNPRYAQAHYWYGNLL
jgi:adenylate cyclase